MALITIGPRQIIGVSSATRKPIDMHLDAEVLHRVQRLAVRRRVRLAAEMPIRRGSDGP